MGFGQMIQMKIKMPAWAEYKGTAPDGRLQITIDSDKMYPWYLQLLAATGKPEVQEVTAFSLTVARRCATEDLKKLLPNKTFELYITPSKTKDKWNITKIAQGPGYQAAAQGFRHYYNLIGNK